MNEQKTTTVNAEAAKEEKDTKLRLRINNAPSFDPLIQTLYTDTAALCDELINPVMHTVFTDYFGSKIEIAQNRSIVTSLFFSEPVNAPNDGRAHAIQRLVTAESMKDIDNRLKMINNSVNTDRYINQYQLSQDGKDVLEEIIPAGARKSNGQVNWDSLVIEGCINNGYSYGGQNNQVLLQVVIDINRFIRKVYGATNPEKDETYQYMVTIGNPINPVSTYGGNLIVKHWQMFIMRLTGSAIEKVARAYGMSGTNNLGIIV